MNKKSSKLTEIWPNDTIQVRSSHVVVVVVSHRCLPVPANCCSTCLVYSLDANQNNDEDTTVKFQQVSRAYQILSDPSLKQQYDIAIQSMSPGQDLAITIEVDYEMSQRGGIKWVHMRHNGVCDSCRGSGTWHGDTCKTCQGVGISKKTRRMTVDIPAGIQNRYTILVKGQGVEGSPAGDLYVTVIVGDEFSVDGPDMGWTSYETISYVDATLAGGTSHRGWQQY